jgi:hypothetical protein
MLLQEAFYQILGLFNRSYLNEAVEVIKKDGEAPCLPVSLKKSKQMKQPGAICESATFG